MPTKDEEQQPPIGTKDGTVRVLNFAGGGFDTVMQLGVTHSLLVNQGKAPDVVVGVSAGAIEAAALAEILRAGSMGDAEKLDPEEYKRVLNKRVQRFREFSDACHAAPEAVVDSVMPDMYRVDSFEPMASLRLPRLAEKERDDRDAWIQRRAGLEELYNDILQVDLPFGAITRIVRRWLGFKGAAALASRWKRAVIRFLEFMRLWLVLGSELRRLTPLVPILVRPLLSKRRSEVLHTAGSIIFKFRPVVNFWKFLTNFWSFLFVAIFWFLGSLFILLFPLLLALVYDGLNPGSDASAYLLLFLLLYLVPIALPLTPLAIAYDKTRRWTAAVDFSKGAAAFLFYIVKWTIALALIGIGVLAVVWILQWLFQSIPGDTLENWVYGEGGVDEETVLIWTAILLVAVVLLRPIVWLIRGSWSYRIGRKGERTSRAKWYARQFLDYYRLGPSLSHNYQLKKMLVCLFDKEYYGKQSTEKMLSESLTDEEQRGFPMELKNRPLRLSEYSTRRGKHDPVVHVGITTADVGNGDMRVMPRNAPVVDSMLAATAITPFFEPVEFDFEKGLHVDAVHFGNAPTKALVELFRDRGLADVQGVHIYPVDSLPISRRVLGAYAPVGDKPYVNLVDIVLRALQLQHFRDAKLERKLTKRVTWAMPDDKGTLEVTKDDKTRKYFKAYFAPIELEHSPNLNRKVLFGSKDQRRESISQTIASGCRASLQVMHAETLENLMTKKKLARKYPETQYGFIKCSNLLNEVNAKRKRSIPVSEVELPGSNGTAPGLAEICKYCQICEASGERIHANATQAIRLPESADERERRDEEVASIDDQEIRDWPHEFQEGEAATGNVSASANKDETQREKRLAKDLRHPSIACLFSGGVFRGVFQLGVLNALSMLDVKPRIVAGASVGSITAAMVSSALVAENDDEKKLKVATLASVYLAIDRIILTDRFSDFIRNWTIRASESKFSLNQMDRVFRRFDESDSDLFQQDLRQVLAGIERLFYVNPYQINDVVHAVRNREGIRASGILKECAQRWLDQMDVGEEVLGAEAIQELIEELVIPDTHAGPAKTAPFDCIHEDLTFLATTTNLTTGELEILDSEKDAGTTLIDGLLASSAFPGVFRPRRSWDLEPGTHEIDQYIDGGVMDNLPLHSVLKKMRTMADEERIPLRSPHGPHLMLAASLEVDTRNPDARSLDKFKNYWPEMAARASELKYNTKLDMFERVITNMNDITSNSSGGRQSLDVRLMPVKPKWLCSTFAFHPMLGFRRQVQAESIAHGCAATLLAFGNSGEAAAGWKLNAEAVPDVGRFRDAFARVDKRKKKQRGAGKCWLTDVDCPFSRQQLDEYSDPQIDDNTRDWLEEIHTSCWKRETHEPR